VFNDLNKGFDAAVNDWNVIHLRTFLRYKKVDKVRINGWIPFNNTVIKKGRAN